MTAIAAPAARDLAHIPHLPRTPLLGHNLQLLRDPFGLHMRSRAALGDVYKIRLLGQWRVAFAGADACELVFEDRDKHLSSFHGWDMIQRLFAGGLMLRDFDDHRIHRRIMQSAFRKPAVDAYRDRMDALMPGRLAAWPQDRPFAFYPAIKDLTLRMSTTIFMGLASEDPRVGVINKALMDEVAGGVGIVRVPLPGTALRRGIRAREIFKETLREMIPERRADPGPDFFSQLCAARDEDGAGWSEEDILDHFNFLMMAAHDTTASTLAKVVWALGVHPEWQERLRAEIDALPDGPIDEDGLNSMELCQRVAREALRLMPPVPFIPRRTTRAFEWKGHHIPAGTWVSCLPATVMRDPEIFTRPNDFDPDRFSPNRAEHQRHKYAWTPFGGGAHKCIGLHFAMIETKLFLRHLLSRYRIEIAQRRPVRWAPLPTPRPIGGMPIRLLPRDL